MGSEKFVGPDRQFVAKGDRSRMLQMGAASHRRCPIGLGVCQKALYGITETFGKKSQVRPGTEASTQYQQHPGWSLPNARTRHVHRTV